MSKFKSVNFIGYCAVLISMLFVNIPSVSSKENWAREYEGIRYQLNFCKRQRRQTVTCNFTFVNEEDYKKIFQLSLNRFSPIIEKTRILDTDGNQYGLNELTIGSQIWNRDKGQTGDVFFLTPGIKYKTTISFRGVPDSVTQIAELVLEHMHGHSYSSSYLNIPILK